MSRRHDPLNAAAEPAPGRVWKRPESVLVVVHAEDGQVLLLQRADDPEFWQSVTGSLERGESPAQAAQRELREETGLVRAPRDLQTTNVFEIRGRWRERYAPEVTHNREHVFAVCLPGPVDVILDPAEHLDWRWLPAQSALTQAASSTNRAAIRQLSAASGQGGPST